MIAKQETARVPGAELLKPSIDSVINGRKISGSIQQNDAPVATEEPFAAPAKLARINTRDEGEPATAADEEIRCDGSGAHSIAATPTTHETEEKALGNAIMCGSNRSIINDHQMEVDAAEVTHLPVATCSHIFAEVWCPYSLPCLVAVL